MPGVWLSKAGPSNLSTTNPQQLGKKCVKCILWENKPKCWTPKTDDSSPTVRGSQVHLWGATTLLKLLILPEFLSINGYKANNQNGAPFCGNVYFNVKSLG